VAYHFFENYEQGEDFSIDFQPDYTWADDLTNDSPLPRIPPLRVRVGANYSIAKLFNSRIELQQVFKQSRTADEESDTDGFTLLNAVISRDIVMDSTPFTVFLRGNNLLNEKAREHTSFIKDVAPLPGMNITTGVQVRF
jgi:iron complex outermembrane receptor protein